MASLKLTTEQEASLKQMLLAGATPEGIKQTFGISLSSAHNYRKRIERETGIKFASVRGKRPSTGETASTDLPAQVYTTGGLMADPNDRIIRIQGLNIRIQGNTREVIISENGIDVIFNSPAPGGTILPVTTSTSIINAPFEE